MSREQRNRLDDQDDAVFRALASPTRRRMLDVLKQSSCTTGELCSAFADLDRTTILQHLRVLEAAELVTGRKIGRERHLAIAPLPIKRISDRWIGEYARAAVDLLEALSTGAAVSERTEGWAVRSSQGRIWSGQVLDDPGRSAGGDTVVRQLTGDHAVGADHHVPADLRTRQHDRAMAEPRAAADRHRTLGHHLA